MLCSMDCLVDQAPLPKDDLEASWTQTWFYRHTHAYLKPVGIDKHTNGPDGEGRGEPRRHRYQHGATDPAATSLTPLCLLGSARHGSDNVSVSLLTRCAI